MSRIYYNAWYEEAHKNHQLEDLEKQGYFFWEDGSWNVIAINAETNTFLELRWDEKNKNFTHDKLKLISESGNLKEEILNKIEVEKMSN